MYRSSRTKNDLIELWIRLNYNVKFSDLLKRKIIHNNKTMEKIGNSNNDIAKSIIISFTFLLFILRFYLWQFCSKLNFIKN